MAPVVPHFIQTIRLILRSLDDKDLGDVVRIVGDYAVSQWLVPVPHPYTRDNADQFFAAVQTGDLGFIWALVLDGRFVGLIGAGPALGYWLCPSVWGLGLMTEAAQAVVDAFFHHTNEPALSSSYFVGNHGSAQVLKRIGFLDQGPGQSFSQAQNKSVPTREMLLTRARWVALTASEG